MFASRRETFMKRMEGGVALFFAAPQRNRSADSDYAYRQDSYFHYLTGFGEPGAAALLLPDGDRHRFVLFVRPRDREKEIWNGRRAGPEGARSDFGADEARTIDELPALLTGYLENAPRLYHALGRNPETDALVKVALDAVRGKARQGIKAPAVLVDPASILDTMRLVKSAEELGLMRRAASISSEAHNAAMRALGPGMREYEIEALIEYHFRRLGATAPGYNSIVGSGENATILHYVENDAVCRDGELLLVDAGAEYRGYNADITRTYPVSGRFTGLQRDAYEIVLAAQLAAIDCVRPGRRFIEYHDTAVRVLVEGLVSLGILAGDVDGLIEQKAYQPYYMHRTGHWLGLDVHDVGDYRDGPEWRKLEPGMVLTVEPGLYFARDLEGVPDPLRGVGIRIEDDVAVTRGDPEILTAAAYKTVAEIESVMAEAPDHPLVSVAD